MHCDNCNVDIKGNFSKCPLCNVPIKSGKYTENPFPEVKMLSRDVIPFLKKSIFFSVVVGILCVTINFLFTTNISWSLFVLLGIASMWIFVYTAVIKRHNVYKNILWQVFFISVISIIWDFMTGWHNWSLDFAMPITFMCSIIAMSIIAKAKRMEYTDYIVYLIIDIIFGLIPLIFLILQISKTTLPSVMCLVLSAIYLTAMFVFEGKNLIVELRKILHL